jgi:hypothetical protein
VGALACDTILRSNAYYIVPMTAWRRRCRRIHLPAPRYTVSLADLNLDPKGRGQFFDGRGFLLAHLRAAVAEETALLLGFGNLCATETNDWLNL